MYFLYVVLLSSLIPSTLFSISSLISILKVFEITIKTSDFGVAFPLSHLITDCLDTPIASAKESWDKLFSFLNSLIFSPIYILIPQINYTF